MMPTGPDAAYRLRVANALWGRVGEPFRPEFLALTRREYDGGFRELDFASDPDAARDTINRWVSEKTEERIPKLLNKEDIDFGVVLVLTNAVYFKGEWERPFPVERTRETDFEVKPGKRVKVPMMNLEGGFRYAEGDGVRALELPYRGERLSMVLLLPAERQGLAELVRSLTTQSLSKLIAALSMREGELSLPRFQSNSRFNLNKTLKALGMESAFHGGFTGMTPKDIAITRVIHQAEIETNEQGTVASAATAVMMARSDRPPLKFRADEPFLYLIRDRVSGGIVFVGRVSDPSR